MDSTQEHQPNADTQALLDQLFVKVNALNTVGEDGEGHQTKGGQTYAALVVHGDTPSEAVHGLWDIFSQQFHMMGGTVYWRQLPSLMKIDGQYVAKMRLVVVYEGDQ